MIPTIWKHTPPFSIINWLTIETLVFVSVLTLPFSSSWGETGIAAACGFWLWRKIVWREKFPSLPPCNIAYAAFMLAAIAALFRVPSHYLWISVGGVLRWGGGTLVFFMCYELFQEEKRRRRILTAFTATMVLACLVGVFQMAQDFERLSPYFTSVRGTFVRLRGPFNSANQLAAFLLLTIPATCSLWLSFRKRPVKGFLLACALATFCIAFFITLSRSAFLGLFVSLLLYGVVRKNKWVLLSLLVLCAPLFLPGALRENLMSLFETRDITVGFRLDYWRAAWGMIRENPWIGVGVNMYAKKFPLYAAPGILPPQDAHNCYLEIWSEMGLLGLVSFLIPLGFVLWKKLFRAPKDGSFSNSDALLIGLTAFLVQSAFDTNLFSIQGSVLFWTFWGLAAGGFRGASGPDRESREDPLKKHAGQIAAQRAQ